MGRLRSIPERLLATKAESLLELFRLGPQRYAPISSYSKGMRQKILICGALLHNPDVLIFDEPLSGLDVTSVLVFRDVVKSLAGEGKIILYTSHILEVIEKLCSRVMILHRGRVAANDRVERLEGFDEAAFARRDFPRAGCRGGYGKGGERHRGSDETPSLKGTMAGWVRLAKALP